MDKNIIITGDVLDVIATIEDKSCNCCVTSPPYYGLRNYAVDGQIGLEETPDAYVQKLVEVFREVRRVLKDDGTLWLNLGDSYAGGGRGFNQEHAKFLGTGQAEAQSLGYKKPPEGLKHKDLIGIPWMVAFALRTDGWYLRQDIIWHKPNPMPESVTDRCTKAHEYIFLLSKSQKYYYNADAIKENATTEPVARNKSKEGYNADYANSKRFSEGLRVYGEDGKRNKRSVWTVTTKPFSEAHFAAFPQDLIVDCIKAGCPENGMVIDPFMGAGTTAVVSRKLNRNFVGIELNPKYTNIANTRLKKELGMFL